MIYSDHQKFSSYNRSLPPWEAYHRAMLLAHTARGQYLRSAMTALGHEVRERFCAWARERHFRFCPLCC